ncbi:MAG: hypothetical protein CVV44_05335 [Spirochaetae bacterium HGW-Spirochaetae-1]|nr:MAG: hypothetical protein CVV44_05335 [Spirochaetae bacterium HGW-Spirochaetae-1]
MISECLLHCPGIGPRTETRFRELGLSNWDDCLEETGRIPMKGARLRRVIDTLERSREALATGDIAYFVNAYPAREHWRILAQYFDRATWFDIETTGLSWHYNHASVIAAWHRGKMYSFVHGENLDDFLMLVDDSELLVTFNGNCFDIPFIEKTFNIPEISCPHVDLRWVAYHEGYRGGLKSIEKEINIRRPGEIKDVDGFEAVDLYYRWQAGDRSARDKLVAYCRADALSVYMVAARILARRGVKFDIPGDAELFDAIRE